MGEWGSEKEWNTSRNNYLQCYEFALHSNRNARIKYSALVYVCVRVRLQCSNWNNKIQRRSPLRRMEARERGLSIHFNESHTALKMKKKLNCSMKKDKRFYIKIRLYCRDKNDEMIAHTAWQLRRRRRQRRQMTQSMKMKWNANRRTCSIHLA